MKKLMNLILSLVMLLLLAAAFPAEPVLAAGKPRIAITYVPPRGKGREIQGQVFMEDGSDFNPSDYRISLYLQVEPGGQYWVKPYYDEPYVELFPDGSFSGRFVTGGEDNKAKVLHVMLIPADYTPGRNGFYDTQDVALDYVKITRTEDGKTAVEPLREAPEPPGFARPTNALLPVEEDKIAVDIGFYTDGSQPGDSLSEVLIRRQLTAVSYFANTVRFYGSAGELDKAYKIAHDMGFSVVGTAWLSGNEAADKEEMDALIRHCNSGYVAVACVGNEALLRNDLTPKELVDDINYVRERLTDKTIPVTTSDGVDILRGNPYVRNACNLIAPTCHPYWAGMDISQAAGFFIESIEELEAMSGGKQILASETGWPTDGQTKGQAVPGDENAAAYFDQVRDWSLASGTRVFWFEASEEPWKVKDEGQVGRHWGLLTTDFELKEGYAGTEFFREHPYEGPGAIDLSVTEISGLTAKVYTGYAITQSPVVKLGSVTLKEGTDYTLSYVNNTNVGTATLTITGKGYYTGTVSRNFTISQAAPTLRFETGSLTKTEDDAPFTNKLTAVTDGSVTYESSDTAVAEVDKTSGNVTIKGVGVTEITATAAAGVNYKAGSAKYTLTVKENGAIKAISLSETSITMVYGEERTAPSVTYSPESATDEKTVDWSSSNEAIVTMTGDRIRAMDPGKAVITATVPGRNVSASADVRVLFTDVTNPGAWYFDSVYWALENGVTSGMGEGTFQPTRELTRAQTVTFLYNLAGKPDVSGLTTTEFSDVAKGAWYYDAVKWAVANKITSGYGIGTFQPNAKCTRAMVVTFLQNYAKAEGFYKAPTTSADFKDVKTGDWFKESVDWAVENGITAGYGTGTFSPKVICNRAMMVTFLKKAAELPKVY